MEADELARATVDVEELEKRTSAAKRQVDAVMERLPAWTETAVTHAVEEEVRKWGAMDAEPVAALAPLHKRVGDLIARVEQAEEDVVAADTEEADEIEARAVDVAKAVERVEAGVEYVSQLVTRAERLQVTDDRGERDTRRRESERLSVAARELAAILQD
jgi:hypothetical protein